MRVTRYILCIALVILTLITTVFAAPKMLATSGGGVRKGAIAHLAITSVKVSPEVTEQEAAQRLSYLGLLGGSGWKDGKIDFELDRNITKLESVILTARMLGVETELLENPCEHPFTDVPDWGSAYVGYFYQNGVFDESESTEFLPDNDVSSEEFLTFMFYALGFTSQMEEYNSAMAGVSGLRAGICTELKDSLTRGDAAMMLFRTLNATMNGSDQLLSQALLEKLLQK